MACTQALGRLVSALFVLLLLAVPVGARAAGSLPEAAALISDIMAGALKSKTEKPLVFVCPDRFADTLSGNISPFADSFAQEMGKALLATGAFRVTADPKARPDLYLNGYYYHENDHMVVGGRLLSLKALADKEYPDVASARTEIPAGEAELRLMTVDVGTKTRFLMNKLLERYVAKVGVATRPEVLVEPFSYQSSGLYSPFADAVRASAEKFLAASGILQPFAGAEKALVAASRSKKPLSAQTASAAETVALLSGADLYLAGSFWPGAASIEIKAMLATADGQIMGAESVSLPLDDADPVLLAMPQTEDKAFMAAEAALGRRLDSRGLKVEVFTQRGASNVRFAKGERSVYFFRPSGRQAYVRLFKRTADGRIIQLWPNAYADGKTALAAGEVACVPDGRWPGDAALVVEPPLGGELVVVFASDKPLPEPPVAATDAHGLKSIALDPSGLGAFYGDWAKGERARLARDALAVSTGS